MGVETRSEPEVRQIGPFRVVRRLASCGAREAFLAADSAQRHVVLKVLSAPPSEEGLLDPRIADEASTYARLAHPNLVQVVQLFSVGGRLLIALENIEGSTLNVVRAALTRGHHKVDDGCWYYVAHCIFAGLAAAHGALGADGTVAPIVHRNVNPSNVHVAWDGAIKLGDFGVASIVEATRDSNPGLAWGSYGYLAPEQANTQPVGPHSDVYSATLVLWELLAGRKAVERGTESATDLLDRICEPNFPSLDELRPDVDGRVLELVRAGLHPDPSKRTVDAARACDILRGVTDLDAARRRFASTLAVIRSERARGASPVSPVRAAVAPKNAAPRRPPPVPPRRAAAPKPPVPVEPSVAVVSDLDIEPAPESTQPTSRSAFQVSGPANVVRRPSSAQIARPAMLAAAVLAAAVTVALLASRGSASPARRVDARLESAAPTPQAPPVPPSESAASAPAPVASPPEPTSEPPIAETPLVPSGAADLLPAGLGELLMPRNAAGHRIYVDGRTVGEGLDPIRVSCGPHAVRIGSAGRVHHVDVPCGSSLPLTR
jgi:serine/threonine protein kinase